MTLHVEADRRRNRGAQKLYGLVHDGIGVDVRFAGRLMPAEGEDLLDEMFRAVAGDDDLLRVFQHFRIRRKILDEESRISQDRGENIVEVVGDAAGQPAHRLHLLRAVQLVLQVAAFLFAALQRRDIAMEDDRSAIGGTTFADQNPSAVGELTLQIVVAQAVLVETRLTPLVRRLARSGFTSYFRHDDELITGTED